MSPNLIAFCRIIKRRCSIKDTAWRVPSSSVFHLFSPFLLLFWHTDLLTATLISSYISVVWQRHFCWGTELDTEPALRGGHLEKWCSCFLFHIYRVGDVQKLWLLRHITSTEVFKHFHSLAIFHTSWTPHSFTCIGCSQHLWKLKWDFVKFSYNPVGLMMQNLNKLFSDI